MTAGDAMVLLGLATMLFGIFGVPLVVNRWVMREDRERRLPKCRVCGRRRCLAFLSRTNALISIARERR